MTLIWLDEMAQVEDEDEGFCHYTCCIDGDTALCGMDVSDSPLLASGDVDCAACLNVADSGECPCFGACLEEEFDE